MDAMKKQWMGLVGLVLVVAIAACGGPAPEAPEVSGGNESSESVTQVPASPSAPSPTASSLDLGTFAFDEIYEIGAAGCGLTLWTPEENAKPAAERGILLLNGLDEESMLMKINGEIIRFQRIAASGDPFYGQFTSQTFRNEAEGIQVQVDVTLGQQGEIESVAIPSGTIRIEADGETQEIPVVGDAGC